MDNPLLIAVITGFVVQSLTGFFANLTMRTRVAGDIKKALIDAEAVAEKTEVDEHRLVLEQWQKLHEVACRERDKAVEERDKLREKLEQLQNSASTSATSATTNTAPVQTVGRGIEF